MPNLIRISVLAALMTTVTASAYAEDVDAPHEERRASVAALIGYGFDLTSDDQNPFGFGFGVAGGYSFDSGIYLGGQFLYFGGETQTVLGTDLSVNIVTLGMEAGYNLHFDPVIVRPTLGMGVAFTNESPGDGDFSSVYFAPGVTVIYPIKQFFVGGDARLWLVTGDTRTGLSLLATGGITF
jgi:hypothetical protein